MLWEQRLKWSWQSQLSSCFMFSWETYLASTLIHFLILSMYSLFEGRLSHKNHLLTTGSERITFSRILEVIQGIWDTHHYLFQPVKKEQTQQNQMINLNVVHSYPLFPFPLHFCLVLLWWGNLGRYGRWNLCLWWGDLFPNYSILLLYSIRTFFTNGFPSPLCIGISTLLIFLATCIMDDHFTLPTGVSGNNVDLLGGAQDITHLIASTILGVSFHL